MLMMRKLKIEKGGNGVGEKVKMSNNFIAQLNRSLTVEVPRCA